LRKLATLIALAMFATLGFAQNVAKGNPDKDKAPQSAIDHSGQVAAVDAKGKLRQPTPEELQALANDLSAKLNQTIDESKVLHQADGSLAVFTGDIDMNFILMKTNADGTKSTRCVENPQQVREFLGLEKKVETKNTPKRDANGLEVE
jgi:Tol biopolymer transport system component